MICARVKSAKKLELQVRGCPKIKKIKKKQKNLVGLDITTLVLVVLIPMRYPLIEQEIRSTIFGDLFCPIYVFLKKNDFFSVFSKIFVYKSWFDGIILEC